VPEGAKQAEEAERQRSERWGWVEPGVWTERMLAALEHGVKGGKWFSLMDNHQRWPDAFFVEQGLFTMTAALALARQSR
jgi:hypothetical protein